ncbi:MAG: TRAP transporter small permease [Bacillaceae bacterium]|nr:TRAP transporter small permease [Bacillaceae bacterium]
MKLLKWLDENAEKSLLIVLFSIMVVVVFFQVFMRYVMENSLSWSEELARYCFIWMIYLGISYGVRKRRHIKVDVLLLLFKGKRIKLFFSILANLLFLVFCGFVVKYGSGIALQLLEYGQKAPALQFPIGFVYMAAPVGMGLTAIRLIQNITIDFIDMISDRKGNSAIKAEMNKNDNILLDKG